MGTLKLNNVTAITESGGTVTLNSGTVVPAAGVTGTLDSGVFPAGHVLQVQTAFVSAGQSIVDTDADIVSKTFNRIKGNSKFLLQSTITLAMYVSQANQDSADPHLFWNINGTNYNSIDDRYDDSWYASTVPAWYIQGSNYEGSYEIYQYSCTEEITSYSSGSDNDSIVFKVRGSGGTLGMYVNRTVNGYPESGSASTITIWEVAT